MKYRLAFLLYALVVLALTPVVHAQGDGVVDGQLVNGTSPKIVAANVDLDVVGLGGGMRILKSLTTDAAGRFRVDGLPTDSPVLIRANYKSVNYNERVNFDSSGRAKLELTVFEPTDSTKNIALEGFRLAMELTGDQLRSLEECSFNNRTSPPKSFMSQEGSFRFSKIPGIATPPRVDVAGPGAVMPLAQNPLESADGSYYYSLYPLRPGVTKFEIEQAFHYQEHKFVLRKKFFYDIDSFQIGVVPADLNLSGDGLQKVQEDTQRNFAVYSGGPVKAGTEAVWTFSGGTPVVEQQPTPATGETKIRPMPTSVGQNALVIGPLVLMGFISILWFAFNQLKSSPAQSGDSHIREIRDRQNRLVDFLARLDGRYEEKSIDRREYLAQREQAKRQLRQIAALLGKSGPEKHSKA